MSLFKSDMGLIFAVIFCGLLCVGSLQVLLLSIASILILGPDFTTFAVAITSFLGFALSTFILSLLLGDKGYYRIMERPVYRYQDIQLQREWKQPGEQAPDPHHRDDTPGHTYHDVVPPQENTEERAGESLALEEQRDAHPPPDPRAPLSSRYAVRYGYGPHGPFPSRELYDYSGRYTTRTFPPGPYRTVRFYSFMKYTLRIPKMKTLLGIFMLALFIGFLTLTLGGAFLLLFPVCFIIAFSFPSLMWISYVYHQSTRAPEPRDSIFKALLWGMFSTIPAAIINGTFGYGLGTGLAFLVPVLVAPFNEEFFKPLGLGFLKPDIKSRIDGLVFGVTCGMGFAMTENLLYELSFLYGSAAVWTLNSFLRGVGSTIIHAVGSGLIGFMYASYDLKRKRAREEDLAERQALSREKTTQTPEMKYSQRQRLRTEDEFTVHCSFQKLVSVYFTAVGIHAGWNILATLLGVASLALTVLLVGMLFLYAGLMFLLLKYLVELSGGTMRFQC